MENVNVLRKAVDTLERANNILEYQKEHIIQRIMIKSQKK